MADSAAAEETPTEKIGEAVDQRAEVTGESEAVVLKPTEAEEQGISEQRASADNTSDKAVAEGAESAAKDRTVEDDLEDLFAAAAEAPPQLPVSDEATGAHWQAHHGVYHHTHYPYPPPQPQPMHASGHNAAGYAYPHHPQMHAAYFQYQHQYPAMHAPAGVAAGFTHTSHGEGEGHVAWGDARYPHPAGYAHPHYGHMAAMGHHPMQHPIQHGMHGMHAAQAMQAHSGMQSAGAVPHTSVPAAPVKQIATVSAAVRSFVPAHVQKRNAALKASAPAAHTGQDAHEEQDGEERGDIGPTMPPTHAPMPALEVPSAVPAPVGVRLLRPPVAHSAPQMGAPVHRGAKAGADPLSVQQLIDDDAADRLAESSRRQAPQKPGPDPKFASTAAYTSFMASISDLTR
jgi:hypothetical protein